MSFGDADVVALGRLWSNDTQASAGLWNPERRTFDMYVQSLSYHCSL